MTRQADAWMDGVEDEGKEDKRAAANDGTGRKESKRVSDRAVAGHARGERGLTDIVLIGLNANCDPRDRRMPDKGCQRDGKRQEDEIG